MGSYHSLTALSALALLCSLTSPGDAQGDAGDKKPAERVPAERMINIAVPADFKPSNQLAGASAVTLNTEPHLGGLSVDATVEAQHWADGPITLFITSMSSKEPVAYPDAAIHSEFQYLRGAPARASMTDTDVESVLFTTELVKGGASARSVWRHLDYQTQNQTRALAYRTKSGHLRYVQTECIYPFSAPASAKEKALARVCVQVLASMTIPVGMSAGQPTAPATDGAAPATDGATPMTPTTGTPATAGAPPAGQQGVTAVPPPGDQIPSAVPQLTLRDPAELGDQPMPAIAIEKPKKRNYRNLLLVAGGLLLLLGFYFTTRSRNQVAEEERADDDSDDADDDSDDSDDDSDDSDDSDDDPDNDDSSDPSAKD